MYMYTLPGHTDHVNILCIGGSKVPVVTVYVTCEVEGMYFPLMFDTCPGHHKCLKGSCHNIQEVPSYINR